MPYDPPAPPADVPTGLVEALQAQRPAVLRQAASYAEALAEHREREQRLDREPRAEDDGVAESDGAAESDGVGEGNVAPEGDEDRPTDPPEGVPSKATLTVKEINDNRYYYWQWREGDRIRSKYERPVDPG